MSREDAPSLMKSGDARRYLRTDARPMDPETFRRLVVAGEIPSRKDPETRTTWYSRASLDAWLLGFGEKAS